MTKFSGEGFGFQAGCLAFGAAGALFGGLRDAAQARATQAAIDEWSRLAHLRSCARSRSAQARRRQALAKLRLRARAAASGRETD